MRSSGLSAVSSSSSCFQYIFQLVHLGKQQMMAIVLSSLHEGDETMFKFPGFVLYLVLVQHQILQPFGT